MFSRLILDRILHAVVDPGRLAECVELSDSTTLWYVGRNNTKINDEKNSFVVPGDARVALILNSAVRGVLSTVSECAETFVEKARRKKKVWIELRC